jgi:hypothetical protein
MRYFHLDAGPICAYVRSRAFVVAACDVEQKSSPTVVGADEIEQMLTRSQAIWGAALPYYLLVSRSAARKALSLKDAVADIESSAQSESFLLVAHHDGGLVSVSGVLLPFQADAKAARWWIPWSRGQTGLVRTLLFGAGGAVLVPTVVAAISWWTSDLYLSAEFVCWAALGGFAAGATASLVNESLGLYRVNLLRKFLNRRRG